MTTPAERFRPVRRALAVAPALLFAGLARTARMMAFPMAWTPAVGRDPRTCGLGVRG